jgi:hypothetical protein
LVVVGLTLVAGCGSEDRNLDNPADSLAAHDYPDNPGSVAVLFAESLTCDEARAYVGDTSEDAEFETCDFTYNYIEQTECSATGTEMGHSDPPSALVLMTCREEDGTWDDHNEVYLVQESGLWKVVTANY